MEDPLDEETQTWQPRRGAGFKLIAWLILAMIAAGLAVMVGMIVRG